MRNRRQLPLHAQGASTGINMTQMTQMSPPIQGKPGQPMAPVPGMPMATAVPGAQPMGCYPQAHPYPHGGYPCQTGYSGGSVAMGAGMGFLGGMMVGEMMSHDGGHYGGDYGGGYGGGGGGGDFGGDFSADM